MASIKQISDNKFRASVAQKGYERVSKMFSTLKQAEAWAAKVEADMEAKIYASPGIFENGTVGKIFERYMTEVCPKRKGGRKEAARIRRLLSTAYFMWVRITRLEPKVIREWRDMRLKSVSPQTVNREMNLLSSVFTHAISEWEVVFHSGAHPVRAVARPEGAGPELRHRRWEDHELEAFLKAAKHDESRVPRRGRDYVSWALLLGLETAMRPSEICAATVADVIVGRRYLQLHTSKNGSSRKVPLSTRALEILRALSKDKAPTDRLIPYSPEVIGVYYRQIRKAAGLADADLRLYDIKHEAVSRMASRFSNVLELSAVTGHKNLQSLKWYYNPRVEELAARLG